MLCSLKQPGVTMKQRRLCSLLCLMFAILGTVTAVPQKPGTADTLMGAALHQEEVEGKIEEAISTYRKVLAVPGVSRTLAARAQLRIGICHERLGKAGAREAYEAVLRDYADQSEFSREARRRLAALNASKPNVPRGPIIRQIMIGKEVVPGSPSPDGRYLAYIDKDTDDVGILDLTTWISQRLTHFDPKGEDAEAALEMLWAPKGDRLAYTWIGKTKRYTDLRIVDLSDLTSRSIYKGCEGELRLGTWSSDGMFLLVLEICRFSLVSVKDGSVNSIKAINWVTAIENFALSPDGRLAFFNSDESGTLQAYMVRLV